MADLEVGVGPVLGLSQLLHLQCQRPPTSKQRSHLLTVAPPHQLHLSLQALGEGGEGGEEEGEGGRGERD